MAAMNKVQDKLYLGNIKAASDLKLLKSVVSLSLILNLTQFNFTGHYTCTTGGQWYQAILPQCKYNLISSTIGTFTHTFLVTFKKFNFFYLCYFRT